MCSHVITFLVSGTNYKPHIYKYIYIGFVGGKSPFLIARILPQPQLIYTQAKF